MAKKKFKVQFKHNGIETVVLLSLVLAFFVILAPLAYTSLPTKEIVPSNDAITGLAVSNVMEGDVTMVLLIFFSIAFLVPVELMLRKTNFGGKKSKK